VTVSGLFGDFYCLPDGRKCKRGCNSQHERLSHALAVTDQCCARLCNKRLVHSTPSYRRVRAGMNARLQYSVSRILGPGGEAADCPGARR
jgi:hypothetical protein